LKSININNGTNKYTIAQYLISLTKPTQCATFIEIAKHIATGMTIAIKIRALVLALIYIGAP
jgi:hypothetical protein